MRRAIALAAAAGEAGEIPVGAVLLLDDGRTVEAANEKERRPDPTAHAEMLAIAAAARALGVWRIGGTLYVTKEPCAMCAGAIAAARITRLVFGCADPKGGAAGGVIDILGSPAVNHRVAVCAGVLETETGDQLRAYFRPKRVRRVRAEPASEADGPGMPAMPRAADAGSRPAAQLRFVALYRWRLKAGRESAFAAAWTRVTLAMRTHCGSGGSALLRAEDGSYTGIARWPSRAARDSCRAAAAQDLALMAECVAESLGETRLETVANLWTDAPSGSAPGVGAT